MENKPSDYSPVFKPYNQNQMNVLPPSLDELIPENHLVRLVNGSIDKMNIDPLLKTYKGGGTSSYYPKMLLKVIVYGYINQIYSCRRIGKALRENIHFMWLSGGNTPDFRTINEFRSKRLKKVVDEVFTSILMELLDLGYVKLEHYFVDGSKFKANANKYSYVWAKNTRRYKGVVQRKIKELLDRIDKIQEAEDREYGDGDLEEMGEDHKITSEELEGIAKKIDEALNKQDQDKSHQKRLERVKRKVEKDYLPRLRKYERQERDLSGRNSCSKTDKDATFFRYNNDELLPSYNVMLGTENQFILNYSVHQKANDSVLFIPHMEKLKNSLGRFPKISVGDAGFGSEENYAYLETNGIKNYLKYNTFHQEEKGKHKKKPFHRFNFKYRRSDDTYRCPQGKRLYYLQTKKVKSINGHESQEKVYICNECNKCEYKPSCSKSERGRSIRYNERLNRYRKKAMSNLTTDKGIELRKQRNVEVESVFGQIKKNMGYRCFRLRGLEKVNVEMGLLAISHNIKKMFSQNQVNLQMV